MGHGPRHGTHIKLSEKQGKRGQGTQDPSARQTILHRVPWLTSEARERSTGRAVLSTEGAGSTSQLHPLTPDSTPRRGLEAKHVSVTVPAGRAEGPRQEPPLQRQAHTLPAAAGPSAPRQGRAPAASRPRGRTEPLGDRLSFYPVEAGLTFTPNGWDSWGLPTSPCQHPERQGCGRGACSGCRARALGSDCRGSLVGGRPSGIHSASLWCGESKPPARHQLLPH